MTGPSWDVLVGDCRDVLATLPDQSVHTVITSPPYFGLRDYGTGEWDGGDPACDHARQSEASRLSSTLGNRPRHEQDMAVARTQGGSAAYGRTCGRCGAARVDRQIGLEPTPDEFVQALVQVFREVRRVLRDDGTVWLNLGDSYSGYHGNARVGDGPAPSDKGEHYRENMRHTVVGHGDIKQKDLLGIPWMVAFALRGDGWYLRSEIIWSKLNPMPESVTDRPTKAHEQLFLLSKRPSYFYDADAIREASDPDQVTHNLKYARRYETYDESAPTGAEARGRRATGGIHERVPRDGSRNKRSVWTVATQPYSGAHFATFPPKLIEPCVLAGCPAKACEACGAPWERVTGHDCEGCGDLVPTQAKQCPSCGRRNTEWAEGRVVDQVFGVDATGATPGRATPRKPGSMGQATTTARGLRPSCDCAVGTVPGTVLDPFNGAGTTGLVALRNGRSYVGIELNPEYAQMARERLEMDVRLGHRPPVAGPAVHEAQVGLF